MNSLVSINADSLRNRHKRLLDDIARLQKEADELGNFIRNLERFTEKPPDKKETSGEKVPRPEGIPSTFEMVDMILKSAEKEGKASLTSRELMDEIRAKYWPGVKNSQILPSIFGFRGKRLIREGDRWKRMKK
ncbi:MAG: hypothetical protein WAV72_27910 [Bradyrhizobium sp.]